MKWNYQETIIVVILMLVALAARLYIGFQTPYFSDAHSYDVLRQVSHIRATGRILVEDPLSFSGNYHIVSPFFHYLLAGIWLLFSSSAVLKLVPNLAAVLIIPIVYMIVKKMTGNVHASQVSALAVAFLPGYFVGTYNSLSTLVISIPLIFFLSYALLHIRDQRMLYVYLGGIMVFTLLSPIVFVFLLGFLGYLIMLRAEKMSDYRPEVELFIFSLFLVLWTQFLLYKRAFLMHGLNTVWQNIPWAMLSTYFAEFDLFNAIYRIGIIPFFAGIYIIYRYTFRERNREVYLFISFAIVFLVLLWLKLIPLLTGIMLLGVVLTILLGVSYASSSAYLEKTKLVGYRSLITALFLILMFVSSVVPSVVYAYDSNRRTISPDFMDAIQWLRSNSRPDSVVFSTADEGSLIAYFAGRKNMMDLQFLMVDDVNVRWEDASSIVQSPFVSKPVELIDKYDIDYLFVSQRLLREYGVSDLVYLGTPCMKLVYDSDIRIIDVSSCKFVTREARI